MKTISLEIHGYLGRILGAAKTAQFDRMPGFVPVLLANRPLETYRPVEIGGLSFETVELLALNKKHNILYSTHRYRVERPEWRISFAERSIEPWYAPAGLKRGMVGGPMQVMAPVGPPPLKRLPVIFVGDRIVFERHMTMLKIWLPQRMG